MVRPTRLDYCQYLPSLRRAVNIPPLQGNQRLKFEQAPAGRQVYRKRGTPEGKAPARR